MAQTARNRCDGNVGGYHQACVSVPQAVEVHRREIMRPQEVREPCCQSFQIKGCSVPAGKQQVILHRLSVLHLHSTRPHRPNAQPFRLLIELVFSQHIHTICAHLERAV